MPPPLPTRPDTYAGRADQVADLINQICLLRGDPERWHETRDAAAKAARALAKHLRIEGL